MRIIDTHSHIYADEFALDIEDVINRARKIGVEQILMPNIDTATIPLVHQLSDKYPDYCLPMMGLHPTSVSHNWKEDLALIEKQFQLQNYIAIGEIGIDLYWDKTFEEAQKTAFEQQLRWSIASDLPVVIHSRNAVMECVEVIRKVNSAQLRGVFHSFGGNMEEAKAVLQLQNFMFGVNGVVTFKNSTLPDILNEIDLSKIVIETDAPYLSPMPYRGKRNEPAYTVKVVEKLAEIYAKTPDQIGEITTENAYRIFSLQN